MVRVVVLGQGYVASIFALGVERIKKGDLGYYGIPLADELPVKVEDIEIVGSYDVDETKVGVTVYDVVKRYWDNGVPESLRNITIRRGVHLNSLKSMPIKANGLEEKMKLSNCVDKLVDEWKSEKAEVIINVCTTERIKTFSSRDDIEKAIESDDREKLSAAQFYTYAASVYASENNGAVFVNAIPTPIANDPAFVSLAQDSKLVIFGDDGATGATPLTADILAHLGQRNRYVRSIAQFNIGGNMDFLALTDSGRNKSKEVTKSSIVRDILGYETPHYIKPTGFLEPLGDKKFVAMHIEYINFNGAIDEIVVNARINDSPSLAGLLVDLVRLGKIALKRGEWGTVYEVNAFYMKSPGPANSHNMPRILAYEALRKWAGLPAVSKGGTV
ncbi:MAG: myo-inositol-1-phosphate synthase [Thermoplasmata archaeon]|nr:MAG: myo-inositol-1-phosphate synthase [Thermoplasmata archaeon]